MRIHFGDAQMLLVLNTGNITIEHRLKTKYSEIIITDNRSNVKYSLQFWRRQCN